MIATGIILSARAAIVEARLPAAAVGMGVRIACSRGLLYGRVAALCDGRVLVTPHGAVDGIAPGDVICTDGAAFEAPLGLCALGRAFDAHGNALDGKPVPEEMRRAVVVLPPAPQTRRAVSTPFWTGIPTIDALLTVGTGARIGVFGSPGSGKTTLLNVLVRNARADAVVVGLVGERGREAEEWLREIPERATIFCATGDRSAAERVRAAHLAMAQASVLRSRGLHVLMILDSMARFASALREMATAIGESCGRGGYPPSVLAGLASFTEVAGACGSGSVTFFATILNDGDDRDPVSEAARALLDGHIQLSPALASAGKFPAIDVPASTSRTMRAVVSDGHASDAALVRAEIVDLARSSDARALGMLSDEDAGALADREFLVERFLYRLHGAPHTTADDLRDLRVSLEERRSNCRPI